MDGTVFLSNPKSDCGAREMQEKFHQQLQPAPMASLHASPPGEPHFADNLAKAKGACGTWYFTELLT